MRTQIRSLFSWQNLLAWLVSAAFFGFFLVLGFSTYRDYGTYVDEMAQMEIAQRNYDFLKTGNANLLDFRDWEHGAVFEVFTILTTRFLKQPYPYEELFYLRHLDVYLVFWASGLAFFWLIKKKFRSWLMGLLGSACLFLSPVIFGNAFYNSKDIPLLAFFIFGLLSLTYFLERPNLLTASLHALVCALLINIRIPGVILPALTAGILLVELLAANRRELHPHPRRIWLLGGFFLFLTAGLTILFFPAAWSNPLQRFADAFVAMTARNWTCCCNLYMGGCFTDTTIPWHYVPGWIAVSTPFWYVALFVVGLAAAVGAFFTRPWLTLTPEKRSGLIYLGAFLLPLAAVILGRSVIYNGWRHLYFIYAPFLVLALGGFYTLYQWLKAHFSTRLAAGLLGLITLVSFGWTGVSMIRSHPYENIYFNFLAGHDMQEVKQRFELDYWGLSYLEGFRYILANDPRPTLLIMSNQSHMIEFETMLSEPQRDRIAFVDNLETAQYFITNYYLHAQDYDLPNEVYSVKVGNAKILSVFKLK